MQSGNIKEKEDKRALKEIYEELKNQMSKSRKNFDSKDDQYIRKLRKGRSASPDSIMKSVQTVQQSQHFRSGETEFIVAAIGSRMTNQLWHMRKNYLITFASPLDNRAVGVLGLKFIFNLVLSDKSTV
ncbi:MAG: hypothetical protein ACEY3A_02300 [Wolbachia sp.]